MRHMTPEGLSIASLDQAVNILVERARSIAAKDVMDSDEAAAYLRYARSTFDKLVSKGLIKAHRPNNGDPRFIREELLEFMKAS